jgi:predicted metal-dependent hydrolase
MAAITLAQAQTQLDAYLAAEVAVLGSQSYEIAGRMVTPEPHANAPHHPPAANVLASHAAETNFREKKKRFTNIIGEEATEVNVKVLKSRCGSCNVKGGYFHWKIIMTLHGIADCVMMRELCHLKQHDHSPALWKAVERIVPDYLECKEWLGGCWGAV